MGYILKTIANKNFGALQWCWLVVDGVDIGMAGCVPGDWSLEKIFLKQFVIHSFGLFGGKYQEIFKWQKPFKQSFSSIFVA